MTTTIQPARGTAADKRAAMRPLLLDVAVPLASYYALTNVGVSTVTALALSTVVPAGRAAWALVAERRWNGLAVLMLSVNAVSLALGFVTGDPRFVIAKDSGVSGVLALVTLGSLVVGEPLMSAALRPWVTKGDPARTRAWERLSSVSAPFRRYERVFSGIWAVALLAEAAARVVGAYTLPVSTMVWLGTVMLVVVLVLATFTGAVCSARPLERLVSAEAAGNARRGEHEPEATGSR